MHTKGKEYVEYTNNSSNEYGVLSHQACVLSKVESSYGACVSGNLDSLVAGGEVIESDESVGQPSNQHSSPVSQTQAGEGTGGNSW